MVWDAISFHSRIPLVVIHRNLIAQQYVDEVLKPVELSFMSRHLRLTFQQDNARPYTAHVSTALVLAEHYLGQQSVQISLLLSIISRALQLACDVADLTRQLDKIWHDILQEDIRNLFQSMPSQITACIRARDGQTR